MKTLIITASIVLTGLFASAQSKHLIKLVKEYPAYSQMGSLLVPSAIQVKTGDSLKKAGYVPTGVRGSGRGTILVTYFKYVK